MSEATKIRLRERKSQPRKSWFRPAKTEKGKWLRFYCCLAAVALVLFIAFFGKYFAPYDPLATDYAAKLSAPGGSHLFGTDNVGRDVLSRILYGAGNSFILTFIMIAIVSVLGTVVFATGSMTAAKSFVWWTKYARMARGLASVIRTKDYITEARFGGVGTAGILFRYVLPNIVPQVVIMATLDVGGMMLALAGLSFLGLASQPPTPEWGYMLYEGKSYLQTAPWIMLFAGLAIFITVIVFNLLGDSLRDILDPKEN